eukprot:484416-Pelagomonas_calceolata.AAC.1
MLAERSLHSSIPMPELRLQSPACFTSDTALISQSFHSPSENTLPFLVLPIQGARVGLVHLSCGCITIAPNSKSCLNPHGLTSAPAQQGFTSHLKWVGTQVGSADDDSHPSQHGQLDSTPTSMDEVCLLSGAQSAAELIAYTYDTATRLKKKEELGDGNATHAIQQADCFLVHLPEPESHFKP